MIRDGDILTRSGDVLTSDGDVLSCSSLRTYQHLLQRLLGHNGIKKTRI